MNKQGKGKIEYCDFTWGVVTGCHGPNGKRCSYCYARRQVNRFHQNYPYGFEPTFYPKRLEEPLKRRKPARIFVGDMADLMGDWNWKVCGETMDYCRAGDLVIEMVLNTVRSCPQHTFLFLTKNPAHYAEFNWPENCWLGTTVTCQDDMWRVEELVKAKAKVHWLSVEPMLGPVDIRVSLRPMCLKCGKSTWLCGCDFFEEANELSVGNETDEEAEDVLLKAAIQCTDNKPMVSWVVAGPQTGHGAPQTDMRLFRNLRDQCTAAGVPFFLKGRYVDGKLVKGPILDGRIYDGIPGVR